MSKRPIEKAAAKHSSAIAEGEPSNSLWIVLFSIPALWIGRVLAIGLIGCSPWNYGMVHWQSQVVLLPWCGSLLILGLLAAPASGVRLGKFFTSPISLGLVLLVAVAAAQTVVLPEAVWQAVAPGAKWERLGSERAAEVERQLADAREPLVDLAVIDASSAIGSPSSTTGRSAQPFPRTLSIHPLQTQASLGVLASAVAFFLAAGCLFPGMTGGLMLLLAIACTTTAFSVWGLVDEFVGESSNPLGFSSLISPNSSPQLLAIGFGSLLGLMSWWATRRWRKDGQANFSVQYQSVNPIARLRRRMDEVVADLDVWTACLGLGMAAHFVGVVATASRGGIIGFFAALMVFGVVALLPSNRSGKSGSGKTGSGGAWAIFGFVLLAALAVIALGLGEKASSELASINEEAYVRDNIRLDIWRWSVSEPAYWLLGAGLGTYHFAILPNYGELRGIWFYHAENIYVELFTEFGGVGLLALACVAVGIVLALSGGTRKKRERNELLWPAAGFSICALGVQLLSDFSLVIPAIFVPMAALMGAFTSDGGRSLFAAKPRRRDARKRARERLRGENSVRGVAPNAHADATELPLHGSSDGEKPAMMKPKANMSSGRIVRKLLVPVVVAGLLLAILQGQEPLRGFAVGEKLERRMTKIKKRKDYEVDLKELTSLEREFRADHARHPEVAVQLGRLRQWIVSLAIADSGGWQSGGLDDFDLRTRAEFSAPDVVSAANRGGASGILAAMKPVLDSAHVPLAALADTNRHFLDLARVCPLDWRVYWGQIRSNLGQMERGDLAKAYAMLQLCGRHRINTLETVGLTAIWSGESDIGRQLLQQTIAADPQRAFRMVRFLSLLSAEDLVAVVDEPLLLAQVLERMGSGRSPSSRELAEELAVTLELEPLADEAASESEWTAVAFLAEKQGDIQQAIEAMQKAVGKSPFKWPLRYRLAKLFEKNQQFALALDEMRKMGSVVETNAAYAKFVRSLKEKVLGE